MNTLEYTFFVYVVDVSTLNIHSSVDSSVRSVTVTVCLVREENWKIEIRRVERENV